MMIGVPRAFRERASKPIWNLQDLYRQNLIIDSEMVATKLMRGVVYIAPHQLSYLRTNESDYRFAVTPITTPSAHARITILCTPVIDFIL